MSNYRKNKLAAIFNNKDPSLADQAGARDTDINVIVGRFLRTGTMPGAQVEPMYGDFSQIPGDLREMMELAQSLDDRRRGLPPQLRDMELDELLALTPDDIKKKLTPVEPDKPTEAKS